MAMKRIIFPAITCAVLAGGVAAAKLSAWPASTTPATEETAQPGLTEAMMARSDNHKVVQAIEELCLEKADIQKVHASTTFQVAAKKYSEELTDKRIQLDEVIRAERSRLWWFQIGIAAFGGLATIMMGVKPLCDKLNVSFYGTAVAAFAIIFSSTVTTLSSLSAFANTQADLLQHQRTLAQLQQLHWRVGNDVFAATQLCDQNSNTDLGKVGSWKDRFEEITNEAMPNIAKPGDLRQLGPANPDGSHKTALAGTPAN
jgi:hypothetical protein